MEIRATRDQIEEFKESILWADMLADLKEWKEGMQQESDSIVDDAADNNPSTASVLLHIGDINGRKKAIFYIEGMLDMFLNMLEDKSLEGQQDRSKI